MNTPEENERLERLKKIWDKVTSNAKPVDHPAMCVQPPKRPKCNTWAERRAQLKQIADEHAARLEQLEVVRFHRKWAKLLGSVD
jgi:hypothetical protein